MQAYVISALRSPIGKFEGSLSGLRPDDLAALVIRETVKRAESWLDPSMIDEVILGAANQSGEDNRNVARMALLLAGLPESVPGVTVNRLCASGLQAIADAARSIRSGEASVVIAGGVESMSRAPYVLSKAKSAFDRGQTLYDTTIGWRFTNPAFGADITFSMGETAENVAERWNISRELQDEFAMGSQRKYAEAAAAGRFNAEILPVAVSAGKGITNIFSEDEHPRMSSLEQLAKLKPAFRSGGTVTAGNSSGINDGTAILLLVSEEVVKRFGLRPLARVVSAASAGVAPAVMGIGPVPASQKALKLAGLGIKDIGLTELNEAFAAQSIACIRDLELDPALVNVNGGSIALGHPLGCSGARISATLLHEMQKRSVRYGLASMCVGVGQGLAVIYEGC